MAGLKRGLLRITYKVSGKNINYLPEYLHFRGVNVFDFALEDEKTCLVTIDCVESNKFFAICKNMCYNKKVVGYKGILSPFATFFCRIGLALGVILFTLLSYLLGGVVLGVRVEGSAKCFEMETLSVIESLGVKKYSNFKKIDFDELENAVLKSNEKISFVTAHKQGNILVVSTELSSGISKPLSKNVGDVLSGVDGVVEEISVLRGTALVAVGDSVKKGDALVGAYVLGKEEGERYETFTVARVKVLESVCFEYEGLAVSDRTVELAYALSEFKIDSGEIVTKSHDIIGDKIVVNLSVRHVFYGGNS